MKGKKKKNSLFRRQLPLQMFVLAGILYLFIFSYIPMFGLIMGFKNYDIVTGVKGIFTSEWVGLKYFKEFVNDFNFWKLIKNTVGISVLKMIFTFPLPIVFAIMLNEMGSYHFKKLVQTCSYLPHFVSWVIISGISFRFLSSTGIVNSFLSFIGFTKEAIPFLNSPKLYWEWQYFWMCGKKWAGGPLCSWQRFPVSARICLRQLPLTEQAVCGESGASLCHASNPPS